MAQNVSANGNGFSASQTHQRIIEALEDDRYDWRTIDGISEQTGVAAADVRELLNSLDEVVVRSSIPDESGRALYTTRQHYRQTHSIGARFLDAVAGKLT
jgi:hypothetical protein